MASTVPPSRSSRAPEPDPGSRTDRRRPEDQRHQLLAGTVAALRGRTTRRFSRTTHPLETARAMLDRLRTR